MDPGAPKFWVKMRGAAIIVNGGILVFAGINLYKGNEKFYEKIVMPMTRLLGAETAHSCAVQLAKHKFFPSPEFSDPPTLKTNVWGKTFPNPIGVAAGFDKHGEAVDGLLKVGFGFVEVGSVTPEPQPGNAKPRVFRLTEDKAVINRYGFNSDGHEAVYHRLLSRVENSRLDDSLMVAAKVSDSSVQPRTFPFKADGILGVNLGKNKTSPDPVGDYVRGVTTFGNLADYLVINVSSPNTPGLRDMQKQEMLAELLDKVVEARDELTVSPKPPLLIKIAPDLSDSEKKDIAAVVIKSEVDGIIISNTTIARPESLQSKHKGEVGGLSGVPLKTMSLDMIRDMYTLTNGEVPIVGVGGISNGQDAYDKVKAGASLLQIYTSLVYGGPPVVSKIKREMNYLLKADGYTHLSQAVGADVQLSKKEGEKVPAKKKSWFSFYR